MNILESKRAQHRNIKRHTYNWSVAVTLLLCITNIPMALYTSIVHQNGVMGVMDIVHHKAENAIRPPSVMFLMPCHSTPFYR